MSPFAQNRLRIVRLNPMDVIDYLYGQKHLPHYVRIHRRPSLPADLHVVSLHENFPGLSIDVMVASREFEPVPPGEEVPLLELLPYEVWMYALATEDEMDIRRTAGFDKNARVTRDLEFFTLHCRHYRSLLRHCSDHISRSDFCNRVRTES